jgi:hypothetical protein
MENMKYRGSKDRGGDEVNEVDGPACVAGTGTNGRDGSLANNETISLISRSI